MFNPNNKIFFNNARNCLRIFLRTAKIKELFVPFELCSVVFKAARNEGVSLKFYHIDENFMPAVELPKDAFILYPNYFGICDENAKILAAKYPNFIYDATQSFFAEPLGIATNLLGAKILQRYRRRNFDYKPRNPAKFSKGMRRRRFFN